MKRCFPRMLPQPELNHGLERKRRLKMKMHLLKSQGPSFISILPCAGTKNVHKWTGFRTAVDNWILLLSVNFLVTKSKFISGYIKKCFHYFISKVVPYVCSSKWRHTFMLTKCHIWKVEADSVCFSWSLKLTVISSFFSLENTPLLKDKLQRCAMKSVCKCLYSFVAF